MSNTRVSMLTLKMIEYRVLLEAQYIANEDYTTRKVAKLLGVSKSTAFYDMKYRLKDIDIKLHTEVSAVLQCHKHRRKSRKCIKLAAGLL